MTRKLIPLIPLIFTSCYQQLEPSEISNTLQDQHAIIRLFTSDTALKRDYGYFTVNNDSQLYDLLYRDTVPVCTDPTLKVVSSKPGEYIGVYVYKESNINKLYKAFTLKFDHPGCYSYDLR